MREKIEDNFELFHRHAINFYNDIIFTLPHQGSFVKLSIFFSISLIICSLVQAVTPNQEPSEEKMKTHEEYPNTAERLNELKQLLNEYETKTTNCATRASFCLSLLFNNNVAIVDFEHIAWSEISNCIKLFREKDGLEKELAKLKNPQSN
jgi:hypothetical protein